MFRMDEDRARWFDSTAKIVAVIAAIVGGAWTVYTFLATKEKETKTALIEAQKPFEAKRLELYLELSTRATKLAGTTNRKEFKKQYHEFYEFSTGPLVLVQDRDVGVALVNFFNCLDQSDIAEAACGGVASKLSRACRQSVAESWDVLLPDDAVTFNRLEKLRDPQ